MCLLILLLLVFYGKFCNKKYFVDNSDIGGIKEVFLLYVRLTTLNQFVLVCEVSHWASNLR
jgi:hypothetical protein